MAVNIGPKIGIDGEKQYRDEINRIIQQAKTLDSEMQKVTSSFNAETTAEEKNAKTKAVLEKQIENQKERVKALAEMLERSKEATGDDSVETLKWQQALNEAQTKLNGLESELDDVTEGTDDMTEEVEESGKAAEDSGKRFEGFGEVMKKVGAAVGAVVVAAGAAAAKLTKEVVSAFADYEQLAGGVETLFKDSSDTVMQYAEQAYKTAGLSANEYMETVTSFSASLIQSLGGDTKKAADYSDMAIRDMSDNANKMGSDMETLQQAYAGFAKGQYTLLDNLKLGYGGTKTEMERLLADAEAISGVHYDIDSYADIIDAIHVIQTEMDITGTTAKEAEATISGSIGMLESAVQNLVVGFGRADADIEKLVGDVVDSFKSVVKNITPVVKNIISALPTVAKALISAVNDLLPMLLDSATNLLSEVLSTIVEILPTLLPVLFRAVLDSIKAILSFITSNIGLIIDAIVSLIVSICQELPSLLDTIIAILPSLVSNICSALVKNIPIIISAIITLIMEIVERLPDIIQMIVDIIPMLIETIIDVVLGNLPTIIAGIFKIVAGIIAKIPQIIAILVKGIAKILGTLFRKLGEYGVKWAAAGIAWVKKLWDGIKEWWKNLATKLGEKVVDLILKIASFGEKMKQKGIDWIKNLWSGISEWWGNLITKVKEKVTGLKDKFKSWIEGFKNIGANIVKGIWNGIASGWQWLKDKVKNFVNNIINTAKNILGIHSPSKVFADEVGKMIPEGIAVGIKADTKDLYRQASASLGGLVDASLGTSVTTNMGGVNITVYGAQGQDVNALADLVANKIQRQVTARRSVFA